MDNQKAIELVRNGGTILCLNVPVHTEIGIDLRVFDTGSLFKGIKMIPPGVHLLYYAASSTSSSTSSSSQRSSSSDTAIRTSIFLDIEPAGVYIFLWDKQEEHFYYVYNNRTVNLPSKGILSSSDFNSGKVVQENEIQAYIHRVRTFELDKYLGPYPLEQYSVYRRLSNYILPDVLYRIEPLDKWIHADTDNHFLTKIHQYLVQKKGEKEEDQQQQSSSHSIELSSSSSTSVSSTSRLYYTLLTGCGRTTTRNRVNNSSSLLSTATQQEIVAVYRTQYAIDTSITLIMYIIDLLTTSGTTITETNITNHVLGELQISFLLFYIGQSFTSLEQWKYLTDTFCRCEDILLGNYENIQSILFTNNDQDTTNNDKESIVSSLVDTDISSSSSQSVNTTVPASSRSRNPSSSIKYKKYWETALRILNRNFFIQAYTLMRNQITILFPTNNLLTVGTDSLSSSGMDPFATSQHQNLLSLGFDLQNDTFFVTSLRALGTTIALYERDILPTSNNNSKSSSIPSSDHLFPLHHLDVRQSIHHYLQICMDNFGWEPIITLPPPLPPPPSSSSSSILSPLPDTRINMDHTTLLSSASLNSNTTVSSLSVNSSSVPYSQSTGYGTMKELLMALQAEGGDDDLPIIIDEDNILE